MAHDTIMQLENHKRPYRVSELAELWNLSRDTVIRLIDRHPRVRIICNRHSRKRVYRTRLVPPDVADEIWNGLK